MADIANITNILNEVSLTSNSNSIADNTATKGRDAGLAKLHALLTMENSSSTKSGYFRHAEARALSQRQYYSRATAIMNKPHDHDTEIFPFLALPVELRIIVYHELLVSNDRLILTWRSPRRASKLQKEMHIGILMTCKLCANEGVGVLYGENLFDFEEIRNRPSIAKPLLAHIGTFNFSLIRLVIAEYSAAAEELSCFSPSHITEVLQRDVRSSDTYRLTVLFLIDALSSFNIRLKQLRLFAISIIPYGSCDTTIQLVKFADHAIPGTSVLNSQLLRNNTHRRLGWLEKKNGADLENIVEAICEREKELRPVDFAKDVVKNLSFDWSPPKRHWIAYVRKAESF